MLTDHQIRQLCITEELLNPWSESVSGNGIVSYGLTSAGYDLRLANEIYFFKGTYGEVIDPKKFKDPDYCSRVFDVITFPDNHRVVISPHSYVLGKSVEYIRMPRWLKGQCVGKSTYARSGIIVNTTPIENEWRGYLTIEISNPTAFPICIYTMEGIAQLEFFPTSNPLISYKDKNGKYQNQTGVTPSRVI